MTRIVRVPFLIPTWAAAQVLLPDIIFLKSNLTPTVRLIAHELRHIDQIRELGLLRYWFRYLRILINTGYLWHPMEEEAILAERDEHYQKRALWLLRQEQRVDRR